MVSPICIKLWKQINIKYPYDHLSLKTVQTTSDTNEAELKILIDGCLPFQKLDKEP